jgi:hypothetical protein
MDKDQREQIAKDNRAEVQRARTGLSNRDWAIVFGALIIAVALLGFIYTSDNAGVDPANVEPASGVTPAYDAPATSDTTVDLDATSEEDPELGPSFMPNEVTNPTDQSPNPAD